jgi:hypothetical protein
MYYEKTKKLAKKKKQEKHFGFDKLEFIPTF